MRIASFLFALIVVATTATDLALAVKTSGDGETSPASSSASSSNPALGVSKPPRQKMRSAVLAASFAEKISANKEDGGDRSGDVAMIPKAAAKARSTAKWRALVKTPYFKSASVFSARGRTIKADNALSSMLGGLNTAGGSSVKSPSSSPKHNMQS